MPARVLEAALLALSLVAAGVLVFGPLGRGPIAQPRLVYETLPLLLWAALRFGVGGTSAALLGVTLLASLWSASHRMAPAGSTPSFVIDHILMLQAQLLAMAIPVLGLAAVIQERKHAQHALRASEARYRAVVEAQTELVNHYLPDTTMTFVNGALCRHLGKAREDLLGTKFIDSLSASARPRVEAAIQSLLKHPSVVTVEHEAVLPDGSVRWQQWVHRTILDGEGHIVELQGIGRDMTERRQAEEALKRLTVRLLQVRDEERRRIACELHDGTTQTLAALDLNLTTL